LDRRAKVRSKRAVGAAKQPAGNLDFLAGQLRNSWIHLEQFVPNALEIRIVLADWTKYFAAGSQISHQDN
jgi:hypothetical protein